MAATHRAPKQWALSKSETVNSFESWRHNLQYVLSLDPHFSPYLVEGYKWAKKTKAAPLRGFVNDNETVPEAQRRTAVQKNATLEMMLGQIANYCPIISRNTIVKNSTCLTDIWQAIRLHFGFQSTGGHFLDFDSITLGPEERPEDLFQRLIAFVEDNLLKEGGGITHHSQNIDDDEDMSPTLENFIVLTWLRLINPDLPRLVKQRYGTELRSRTLASIKPEISQALDSLLEELSSSSEARALRTTHQRKPSRMKPKTKKTCPLCEQSGRHEVGHFLSECPYLPEKDRKYLARARQLSVVDDEPDDSDNDHICALSTQSDLDTPVALRVKIDQSPFFDAFFDHHPTRITVDSGCTGNLVRESTVLQLGCPVQKSTQSARQADGSSPLTVVGETSFTLMRNDHQFQFHGLVVKDLDVEILAGIPFMKCNDITIRPARNQIILADSTVITYGSEKRSRPHHRVRRAHVLRGPATTTTVWPGAYLEVPLPEDLPEQDSMFALEPRIDSPLGRSRSPTKSWPSPNIIQSVAGKVRIPNNTGEPLVIKKHEQFGQIHEVFSPEIPPADDVSASAVSTRTPTPKPHMLHSQSVAIDPDGILTQSDRSRFCSLLEEYDDVFDPRFPGYNGAVGPFKAVVNMGPVQPPQRKGRLPLYARDKLQELQHKFDELEDAGVFAKPEDVGVTVEYLNPSFLVKKPSGGYRLVTAFADVGRYSKPQPSLMPDVDSTLRSIAQWKYLIATDLTSAFYQIPLSPQSRKYCGVATPFRGVRVYTRCAMGMPGSETALEELMCRVLGDLLEEGVVAKLADDLYCGGNTVEELLINWRKVLQALCHSGLRLSASKTVICPRQTVILGWMWSNGTLRATSHRVATLSCCSPPSKVGGMRSFIGAYKVLARVLQNCAKLLAPLDDSVAGRQSKEEFIWSDDLHLAFKTCQKALSSASTITLPRPDDQLWIVTDGSVKKHSIGATLYITRTDKLCLAGFFSAKLRGRQPTWLPCEVEALSISASTKHFSPYITQSKHKTCILTDSKPCVQAYEKLCRGEFSASPRVSTFLSTVSRFQASVRHLAGSANLPSDFASRNAPECLEPTCQVCSFVQREEDSTVLRVSTDDILSGRSNPPFASKAAWCSIQQECTDLRRTHAHLVQGTRPSKKATSVKDVKRYLQVASISKDGLLVVRRDQPLSTSRECIIVPRQVLNGLLTALHIRLDHPSRHQLRLVTQRSFFALDMDKAIDEVSSSCHQCASLRSVPKLLVEQSTSGPPGSVGISFAADVIKRSRQLILVVRETTTSYTASCIIDNERHDTLRSALVRLCIELRPISGSPAVVRTDPAPGFVRLVNDKLLAQQYLTIDVGRVKNPNKNPVAEKAIQELEDELLRLDPTGGPITPMSLAIANAAVNSRIRSRGLSSREMWFQRDQFSNKQVPFSDMQLMESQHSLRTANHPHSARSKAPLASSAPDAKLDVGDLVYLYSDRSKSHARDRYLVTSVDGAWCDVRKFAGSQLRNAPYRIKRSECFKVPSHIASSGPPPHFRYNSEEVESPPEHPEPPLIPPELSLPAAPMPPVSSDPPMAPSEVDSAPQSPEASNSQVTGGSSCSDGDHSSSQTPLPDSSLLPSPCNNQIQNDPDFTTPLLTQRQSTRQRKLPQHLKDFVLD